MFMYTYTHISTHYSTDSLSTMIHSCHVEETEVPDTVTITEWYTLTWRVHHRNTPLPPLPTPQTRELTSSSGGPPALCDRRLGRLVRVLRSLNATKGNIRLSRAADAHLSVRPSVASLFLRISRSFTSPPHGTMATENFSFSPLPLRLRGTGALNAAWSGDLSGDNHAALSPPLQRASRPRNFFLTGSGVARTFTMSLISE